jgi:hypothetical protein
LPKICRNKIACFPSLPNKDVLIAKLQLVAKQKKWNLAIEETAKPDKQWLVMMLSTYLPEDEIFKKSYHSPPVE